MIFLTLTDLILLTARGFWCTLFHLTKRTNCTVCAMTERNL